MGYTSQGAPRTEVISFSVGVKQRNINLPMPTNEEKTVYSTDASIWEIFTPHSGQLQTDQISSWNSVNSETLRDWTKLRTI